MNAILNTLIVLISLVFGSPEYRGTNWAYFSFGEELKAQGRSYGPNSSIEISMESYLQVVYCEYWLGGALDDDGNVHVVGGADCEDYRGMEAVAKILDLTGTSWGRYHQLLIQQRSLPVKESGFSPFWLLGLFIRLILKVTCRFVPKVHLCPMCKSGGYHVDGDHDLVCDNCGCWLGVTDAYPYWCTEILQGDLNDIFLPKGSVSVVPELRWYILERDGIHQVVGSMDSALYGYASWNVLSENYNTWQEAWNKMELLDNPA